MARRSGIYLTYGIVPLQIDRSQPAPRKPEPFPFPGVARERDDGIVVRGSQGSRRARCRPTGSSSPTRRPSTW